MTNAEILKKLIAMPNLGETTVNWSEGGGGQVIKVNYDWYVLFEIPQYGGSPRLDRIYHESELSDLIEKAMSWT